MSDKIKEFLEVPQQFVREGNQVCWHVRKASTQLIATVPCSLHKTLAERSATQDLAFNFLLLLRVYTNIQGSRSWIRSYGLHWILCQADSYSNVCSFSHTSATSLTVL